MGLPVVLSQTIIVSLWLVIPTEIIDENRMLHSSNNVLTVLETLSNISIGSCSTQPGLG